MRSTSSHRYKQSNRQSRKVVNEMAFSAGMNFTNNPLPTGQVKLLVNMIQKDYGKRIRPRGGYHPIIPPIDLGVGLINPYIHHEGTTFIKNTVTGNIFLRRYALILDHKEIGSNYGYTDTGKVIIEGIDEKSLLIATCVNNSAGAKPLMKHNRGDALKDIHGVPIDLAARPEPTGIKASIEGNTYMLGQDGLYRLEVMFDNIATYTFKFEKVVPLEVTPTQAVNYGYNMLSPTPYSFPNKVGAEFRGHGILPYDALSGQIKMQAKVGENVQFRLIYEYKQDEKYKVQWEVQDIYKRDGINVIQRKEDSKSYTNGEAIVLNYASPFKQFSVVATVYRESDMTNPVRTIILAAYHLADDSNSIRMEQKTYSLMSATGIATWKNQMVYWGVREAEMSVFVSDINDPTYIPFPNNTLIFNEKVICAFPYMESLLVVTEHTMYQVDFFAQGGFTQKPVQTNLQIREDDAVAMYSIKNMVIFKSRDYFFMIVPNKFNDRGELLVAPISNNIAQLLDNFKESTRDILSEVYTLEYLLGAYSHEIDIKLQDFKSYQDASRIRFAYKWLLTSPSKDIYLEVHLVYDTLFRSWTVEIVETPRRSLRVFQSISTGYAQFFNLYRKYNSIDTTTTCLQWLGIKEDDPQDHIILDFEQPRTIDNFQMMDTGLRDLEGSKVKRMREVILEFNNISETDIEFNHLLYVDDKSRSDLFKFSTVHIVDKNDPEYGRIYIEREFVEPTVLHGTTKLNTWSLGNSQFPQQTIIKAHMSWSGKGYYPRLRLVTRTSKPYELNQMSWVYRDMNAR